MGDPPAIHPYKEYINYLDDVVIFNLRQRTRVGIGFSRANIYQRRRRTGDQTNCGEDEHRL
jgi:hypothetical protein